MVDNTDKMLNRVVQLEASAKTLPHVIKALAIPQLKKIIDGFPEDIRRGITITEQTEVGWSDEEDDMINIPIVKVSYQNWVTDDYKQQVNGYIEGPLKEFIDNEMTLRALGWGK